MNILFEQEIEDKESKIKLYHGSYDYFESFDTEGNANPMQRTAPNGIYNLGAYLALNEGTALTYPDKDQTGKKHYMYEVYLDAKNPKEFTSHIQLKKTIEKYSLDNYQKPLAYMMGTYMEHVLRDSFLESLKAQGFDAISFFEGPVRFQTTPYNRTKIFVAFDTNQIEIARIYEGRVTLQDWTRSTGEVVTINDADDYNRTFFEENIKNQ